MSIIAPLKLDKFISDLKLKEVKSPSIISAKGKYDVDGLFSEMIFGLHRSKERRSTYAFVNLNTKIIHPFIYQVFKKIEKKIVDLIDGEKFYFNPNDKTLSKDNADGLIELSGFDGAMYAISNGLYLRGETEVRDKIVVRLMETIKDGTAFIDKMLVIPPDFRPAQISEDGSLIGVDDLNALYIKLINLTKKIKLTDTNDSSGQASDSSLIRQQIQYLVNDLYDYAKMRIGKKTGINRANILGKRVDFSGRSVVTGGNELPTGKLGVPYRMLANIFEPYLVHYFYKQMNVNSDGYAKFMSILEKNDFHQSNNVMVISNFLRDVADGAIKLNQEEESFLISIFQEVLNDKFVLMKRDPSLHKGSWQAYGIIVITGVAIRVPILQTPLHNMDFDGDTAALFAPLTLEAQEDCAKLMHLPTGANNTTQTSIEVKHELALSCYILSDDSMTKAPDLGVMKIEDVFQNWRILGLRYHIHQSMTIELKGGKRIKTILGRALINSILPKKFLDEYYDGYINQFIDSKFLNGNIIQTLLKSYETKDAILIVDDLVALFKLYISVYPSSLILSEFLEAHMFDDLKKKLREAKTFPEKQAIIDQIEKMIKTDIAKKMPMIYEIIASGSRGKPNQLRQMIVSKGMLQDAQGNILFIDESFIDGLSPTSTFLGGYGGRKGIMDRSRQTATTGYLYRKLIYALASVVFNDNLDNCKTIKTIPCKITKKNATLLESRFIVHENQILKLTRGNIAKFMGQTVNLRSPIYCKSHNICKTCYGDLMWFYHSKFIGIIAAQAMGERGSQEMMKTFHTGGSTNVEVPDLIKQTLDNNPELNKATMTKYFEQDGSKLKFLKNDLNVEIILKQSDYFTINITSFTLLDEEKSDILVESMDLGDTQVKRAAYLKPFSSTIKFKSGDEVVDEFEMIFDDGVFIPIEHFNIDEYRDKDDNNTKVIVLTADTANVPFMALVELTSSDMNVTMQTILNIIERKNVMKHPEVAFNKLSKIYGDDFGIAYNHIEVLISQIFRNRAKPEMPARLIEPYDGQVHSIKNIAHLESFLSGMLFENISKSIQSGFISDTTIQNPLEKLLSDDLDF